MTTKQQRAAARADGFEYFPFTPAVIRNCREGLRGDIESSDYFGKLAPSVVFVPDCLVRAGPMFRMTSWNRVPFLNKISTISPDQGNPMRKHPSRFAERITATLADHGVLSFNGLMVATAVPNNQILSRNLRRLRRDGRASRTVLPTSPPRVLYARADPSTN